MSRVLQVYKQNQHSNFMNLTTSTNGRLNRKIEINNVFDILFCIAKTLFV